MFIDLVLPNHGSEEWDAPKTRIIRQGLLKRLPSVEVWMLRVLNAWSTCHEDVTGGCKSGRAVLVTLLLRVAQSSVVVQAILKEVFRNAVQPWETPLLFCVNLGAEKSN